MPPTKSDSPLPENTQGRHYTLKSAPLSSQPLDQSRPMRQIDPPNRSEIAQVGLVFHRAWPDLQRMKLLLPVARSYRVSFFLVFHRAWPDLQRMKLLPPVARSHRVSFFLVVHRA